MITIDLRSDTVTRPTPGMLDAMITAGVGDDVFGEDPTVKRLEEKIASMFGMEAGLFVPSGTMGNQLCVKVQTGPGDEVIIDETGHIFNYETGAAAHLSSVQLRALVGEKGKLTPELIEPAIRPGNEWDPRSALISLENSTNKGGGACYRREELTAIRSLADKYEIPIHLDGARIWNAMEATGIEPEFFSTIADTISVCFSKGLGAPVGSMILGPGQLVKRARRYRKMWGGGMWQVGLLAAAAEYAVDQHRKLLADDHRRAKKLAEALAGMESFEVDPSTIETNIVLFDTPGRSAATVVEELAAKGVGMVPFGPQTVRATFHFQVSDDQLDEAIGRLADS